ncbi:ArsR/SmtB family transcription factor [Pelagibacterium sp.]|uniref:ArsR/SmtB family transcription factor n=1 Tax=Pelagibacterium sp. TaxID=1967288 RepID=UPI003A8CDCD5
MDIFAVVADPTRRKMIDMLVAGELPAGSFVAAFPNVTQPAISQHLKVLRDAAVVTVRPDKQRRLYALVPDALKPLRDWATPPAPAAEHAAHPEPVENMAVVPEPKARQTKARPKPKPVPEPELTLDLFG